MTLKHSIDWKNEWFPIDDATYLNFAAHAAIPRVALNAVQASVAAKMRPHIVDDLSFFSVAASLRQTLATLIGASPDEIALTTGAGAGLAAIAYALKWSAGDEVIIARGEFPVHYATWKPMETREDIKMQIAVPQGPFIQSDDLVAAMTPRTRVISVSHGTGDGNETRPSLGPRSNTDLMHCESPCSPGHPERAERDDKYDCQCVCRCALARSSKSRSGTSKFVSGGGQERPHAFPQRALRLAASAAG